MAVVTVTGGPGCRAEETARLAAQRLRYELLPESALRRLVVEEYGSERAIPGRVFGDAVVAILARLAREHHLVLHAPGAEALGAAFPAVLRVAVMAPESYRVGSLMIDHGLERAAAAKLLRHLEHEYRALRRRQFGRSSALAGDFDMACNSEALEPAQIAELVAEAARLRGLDDHGLLGAAQEADIQFRARLRLARHGIVPAGKASLARKPFANPSEEMFANLLDFYRIAWDYEPKSFPVQWDNQGRVLESFTPDFYLPEFDLYVELTTMKQANVTRKNRKVKLLKTIYPHINIQVFYQKDFQNLVFKHALAEPAPAI